MSLLLYNLLQIVVLIVFWPALLAIVLLKSKYRRRIARRLGWGLPESRAAAPESGPVIWLHALSVGEVTSALPLIAGLRRSFPRAVLTVSVSTETGECTARELLAGRVDHLLASPVDLRWVVSRFATRVQPDLFILVETDFWPNLLAVLKRRGVPCLLVNGRISQKSLDSYRKFPFFFRPMFQSFSHLCLQTERDRTNVASLGVAKERLHTLGNLKYDTPVRGEKPTSSIARLLPADDIILVAGSTHPGEEEILLSACTRLQTEFPRLYPVLVPRNPDRASEVLELAQKYGWKASRRSQVSEAGGEALVVDTIGELVDLYRHAHVAFVGGSLVKSGGHNPIEPAAMGIPVLFGPHMDDFGEIASDLVQAGGAEIVDNEAELTTALKRLLGDADRRRHMGELAANSVQRRRGVIDCHLELIRSLL